MLMLTLVHLLQVACYNGLNNFPIVRCKQRLRCLHGPWFSRRGQMLIRAFGVALLDFVWSTTPLLIVSVGGAVKDTVELV